MLFYQNCFILCKMKLFIVTLFLVPYISHGFVEPKSFGDEDSENLFQESVSHLRDSFVELLRLVTEGYAPAQQIVSFLNQDFKKAEKFVREHNEMKRTPILPVPNDSQSIRTNMKRMKFWTILPFLSPEISYEIQASGIFAKSMILLTQSFELLNLVKQSSLIREELEFQNRFEKYISFISKKLEVPIHPYPERLTQECSRVFSNSFISVTKKSPKSSIDKE